MFGNKKLSSLVSLLVIVVTILSACTTPTPQVIEKEVVVEKPVIETVIVEKEVVVEKPVVETVIVEKEVEVVVTATPEMGTRKGGTLVIGWSGEFTALDCQHNNLHTNRITNNICENLVGEDTTRVGEAFAPPKPQLAESWDISEDGLAYTFHLREGVKFTDGTPFDAEAVKINFDRYMNEESSLYNVETAAQMKALIAPINGYRVVDSMTFEITLKDPFGSFLLYLKHRQFGITSPTALMEHSADMEGKYLVGTGPFVFSEQEQGVQVVLERNPAYWGTGPYLDKVIFRIMPDDSARLAALQTGEIDVSIVVPADRVADLQQDPNVEVVFPSHAHIMFWFLNHRDPDIQNLKVRQALWHAIDVEGMVKGIFGDKAVPMKSFLPPGNPAYRPDYEHPYPYNPERAKELLAEAGYAFEELKIRICYPIKAGSFSEPGQIAQFVQSYLNAAGFDAELDPYETAAFFATFDGTTGDCQMLQGGWQSIADKPHMLQQLHSCDAGLWNDGQYCNEEFDKLLGQARPLPLEESIPIYQKAEDLLLQEVGTIPILLDKQPRAFHKRVQNLLFGPSTWWELNEVWVQQ